MRLFVGIELDGSLAGAIAADAQRVRAQLDRTCPGLRFRWVDPANLHVTLVFLGDVPAGEVPSAGAALSPPVDLPPFDLELAGLGAFPGSGPLRVIWLGAASGASEVVALHRDVARRLEAAGRPAESRAYAPHLTLARIKDARGPSARCARELIRGTDAAGGTTRVGHVTLFRSHLSPRGSTYEPLLRVPLRG